MRVQTDSEEERFIPACAGNTSRGNIIAVPNSVHPRVCGEHNAQAIGYVTDNGSSPRVRGTLPTAC